MNQICPNHQEKNVVYFCYSCKEYFCELCLEIAKSNYYCRKEKCQELCRNERKKKESTKGTGFLSEFSNNTIVLIIFLSFVGALISQLNKEMRGDFLLSTLPYIFGQMLGLIILPFLLSFISMVFVRDKNKRPKAYYNTFIVIFGLGLFYLFRNLIG